jgi:hypothetical protein
MIIGGRGGARSLVKIIIRGNMNQGVKCVQVSMLSRPRVVSKCSLQLKRVTIKKFHGAKIPVREDKVATWSSTYLSETIKLGV